MDGVTLIRPQPKLSSTQQSPSASGVLVAASNQHGGLLRSTGTLHLTAHHLIFILDSRGDPREKQDAFIHASRKGKQKLQEGEIWVSSRADGGVVFHRSLTRLGSLRQTPYPLISLFQKQPQTLAGAYPLLIHTRTFESLTFEFARDRDAEDVFLSVKELTVAKTIENLYAFYYQPAPPPEGGGGASGRGGGKGWSIYNPRQEFARMGLGTRTKAWRFTDINKDYEYSPTYPAKLVVPAKISDAVLAHAVKYRSKARIPALTYLHWANHASITRCSQPMVGLKNSRSAQDERLVDSIFQSHLTPETSYSPALNDSFPPSTATATSRNPLAAISGLQGDSPQVFGATATNLIVDARPTANAVANLAKGAGTENMENYRLARKVYLGIENIHVMRNSLNQLVEVLREGSVSGTIDRHALRRSNWLKHISALLDGALIIVRNIHINSSHVLIHCSDGWDRTSQLSALAQVCLDPYFRTIKGFQVLIEKDWLAFGHKFLDRCGHLSSDKFFTSVEEDPEDAGQGGAERAAMAFFASVQKQFTSSAHVKETSPVFHQFLDCVWQIHRQYPERFEFTAELLEDLHYHLYSCQFGTFIANNEKQRKMAFFDDEIGNIRVPIYQRTVSIWDWLDTRTDEYVNPAFDSSLDDPKGNDMGVLLVDPREVRYWTALFGRTDEEMNSSPRGMSSFLDTQAQGVEIQGVVSSSDADPVIDASVADIAQGVASVALLDGQQPIKKGHQARDSWHSGGGAFEKQAPARSTPAGYRSEPPSASPSRPVSGSRSAGGGGGGWGWSQISSGALSALQVAGRELQGAAKEIKTFSSETYRELSSAPTTSTSSDLERKSGWHNNAIASDTTTASSSTTTLSQPPRLPSESNPWASSSGEMAFVSNTVLAPQLRPQTTSDAPRREPPSSSSIDYQASSSQLWSTQADRKQESRSSTPSWTSPADATSRVQPQSQATPAIAATSSPSDPPKETPSRRPDNWDPLGAL